MQFCHASCTKLTADAHRKNSALHVPIETAISKLNIKDAEARKLRNICSLEDLQHFVSAENKLHQQNIEQSNGGKLQSVLVKVDDFGKAYEPILGAFKEAVPNGGGHAVWALLGGVFLVAQRKDRREKAISEVSDILLWSKDLLHNMSSSSRDSNTPYLGMIGIENSIKAPPPSPASTNNFTLSSSMLYSRHTSIFEIRNGQEL